MKRILREPKGEEKELVDLRYLENLILNPKEEYWLSGSGDLGIYNYDLEVSSLVLVYCKERNGFFVQLFPKRAPDDWLVAITNGTSQKNVTVSYGGNDYLVPENVIIPLKDTWEVVEYYFKYNKHLDKVEWTSYWDIDWPIIE